MLFEFFSKVICSHRYEMDIFCQVFQLTEILTDRALKRTTASRPHKNFRIASGKVESDKDSCITNSLAPYTNHAQSAQLDHGWLADLQPGARPYILHG